jgi:hypothetical protein
VDNLFCENSLLPTFLNKLTICVYRRAVIVPFLLYLTLGEKLQQFQQLGTKSKYHDFMKVSLGTPYSLS